MSPLLSCNKHHFGSLPRNTQAHQCPEGLRRTLVTPSTQPQQSPSSVFYESLFICRHTFRWGHVLRHRILPRIPTGCEPNCPTIRHYSEAASRVLADCYDVTIGHQNRRAVCNLTNKAIFFIDWPAQILMRGQP